MRVFALLFCCLSLLVAVVLLAYKTCPFFRTHPVPLNYTSWRHQCHQFHFEEKPLTSAKSLLAHVRRVWTSMHLDMQMWVRNYTDLILEMDAIMRRDKEVDHNWWVTNATVTVMSQKRLAFRESIATFIVNIQAGFKIWRKILQRVSEGAEYMEASQEHHSCLSTIFYHLLRALWHLNKTVKANYTSEIWQHLEASFWHLDEAENFIAAVLKISTTYFSESAQK